MISVSHVSIIPRIKCPQIWCYNGFMTTPSEHTPEVQAAIALRDAAVTEEEKRAAVDALKAASPNCEIGLVTFKDFTTMI